MSTLTSNTAVWLERRLDLSHDFHIPASRLYGVVVNDPLGLLDDTDQPARSSFIHQSDDVYELLSGSSGLLARSFDATAVVTIGWAAPMACAGDAAYCPSRHPQRRRVRTVTVVDDGGCASVLRFEDDRDHAIVQREAQAGDLVDALTALWAGESNQFVNSRTTVRGCTHRL